MLVSTNLLVDVVKHHDLIDIPIGDWSDYEACAAKISFRYALGTGPPSILPVEVVKLWPGSEILGIPTSRIFK